MADMVRRSPLVFPDGVFPPALGAVVQRTVLEGVEPAREVIHTAEGDRVVGDGVDGPNEPGATVATHMSHVVERNSSVAELTDLPPGHVAVREGPGTPWQIEEHHWPEE